MNILQRLELWGDTHHPKWLDIIRITLGIFLCYKAISFLMDMSSMISVFSGTNMGSGSFALVLLGQFIVIVHLMGGFLIMIGLHTRLACLAQIPILIGAVFLLSSSGGAVKAGTALFLSIAVLVLLIYFSVMGNGPLSFSKMWKEDKRK